MSHYYFRESRQLIFSFKRCRRNIEMQAKEEAKRLYEENNVRVFQLVLEEHRADEGRICVVV